MKLTTRSKFAWGALGAGFLVASVAAAPSAYAQDRYAAFVIDPRTDEVLHADQADAQRFPASLTKMMTVYMIFEALEKGQIRKDSRLAVSRFAAGQRPSKLGLRRNETISVDTAIRALVTKSANDVAVVVAERLGGSESKFASQMTARARQLGMRSTRFMNASGLPNANQTTTARDMAILGEALMRDFPQHYSYFQLPSMSWRSRALRNHNRLLGVVPGVDGIKTGYTNASGFNLVSSVERGGVRLIAVVMGGETASARDSQMAYLIEGAYEEIAKRRGGAGAGALLTSLPMSQVQVAFPDRAEDDEEGAEDESGEPRADGAIGDAAAPAPAPTPTTAIRPAKPAALAAPDTPIDPATDGLATLGSVVTLPAR